MTKYILHMLGPPRDGQPAVIAGDRNALQRLQAAVTKALLTGCGCAQVFLSDGEPFRLALICESDMATVYTTYPDEPDPQPSQREQRPMRSLDGYVSALGLGAAQCSEAVLQSRPIAPVVIATEFLSSADLS